jgi:hypothetical protein
VTDGLIISKDKTIFDEFNLNISSEVCNFEYANSVESAQEILELESLDFLLIADKNVDTIKASLEKFSKVPEFNKIPVICCTSHSSWEQRKILWQSGVKDIIDLPLAKEEIKLYLNHFITGISKIDRVLQTEGMQGNLDDYNLVDLVQNLEKNKKTGILRLNKGEDEGRIWFYKGNIYEAKFRTLENLDAVYKLITWMHGEFAISFVDEEYEQKIETGNQQILLEAIQRLDQRNKILDTITDINVTLLISPQADMDQMDSNDGKYLKFFHGGKSSAVYLDTFDTDDLVLLEKLQAFMKSKFLMTREQFEQFTMEQDKELAEAGMKNVFSKFFKAKEEKKTKTVKHKTKEEEGDLETEPSSLTDEKKYQPTHFRSKFVDLDRYKKQVKSL